MAPAVARADSGHAGDVAAALQSDPVYVAPSRSERLDGGAAGRRRPANLSYVMPSIHIAILCETSGRLHIAVVPLAWASEAGGARAFANAVDQELRGKGALLVVADGAAHVVTSHDHATAAATGVPRAFDRGGTLEARLRQAVGALADVDPGRSGDVRGDDLGTATPEIERLPDANRIVDDVDDTIKFTF